MPRFSEYFELGLSQAELDFVDVSNEFDTPVYVDPYAIEIQNDVWAAQASEYIRVFFKEVLAALTEGDRERARNLMSHLHEPEETFLGVSQFDPKGRGVGSGQAGQLISAILASKAYTTGLLTDLSEVALYVDGIDRDKISDLTTNIIRELLVDYTAQQCDLHNVEMKRYSGPPLWDPEIRGWRSKHVLLPYIEERPVLLVPKYIVRRKLSLDSQEFYNKQITDFLVAENLRANSSLVQTIKGKQKVLKGDVRKKDPKSKMFIAEMVIAHPDLLDMYKVIAKRHSSMISFDDDAPTITTVCASLAKIYKTIPTGAKHATDYHNLMLGSLTALFYPMLIMPKKEWEINDGRKRVDIVFTNAGDTGFFAQRRNDHKVNANTVIVECKNYSNDLANPEIDQLIGRFDENRGKFGIITCRQVDDVAALESRCRDAASRSQAYILVLTDKDMTTMLEAKSQLSEDVIEDMLHRKYRDLLR